MEPQRMGRLSSAFASRFAQRQPIAHTPAQSATPAASVPEHLGLPQGERTYTMFVQTARAGTWAAKDGEEGVYTLTLTGLPAQTVYFSDRPSRVVGTQSTADFLAALGFEEDNPPNAALVTSTETGEDILVIELSNPVYTEGDAGATLVYDARILENFHDTNLGGIAELQADPAAMPAAFEGASLFIDDCADQGVICRRDGHEVARLWVGCCYHFPSGCRLCWDPSHICTSVAGCEDGGCGQEYFAECLHA